MTNMKTILKTCFIVILALCLCAGEPVVALLSGTLTNTPSTRCTAWAGQGKGPIAHDKLKPSLLNDQEKAAYAAMPGTGEVFLVVAPHLAWSKITNDKTPTLQMLAGKAAVANVISEKKIDIINRLANPRFHYRRINSTSMIEIEGFIRQLYESLAPNDSLLITSSPALSKISTYTLPCYGMLIMVDGGDNGLICSSTVRRSGLITSSNVAAAIDTLLVEKQRNPANLSIYPFTNSYGALQRTTMLSRNDSVAGSIDESEQGFISVFIGLLAFTLLISAALISLDIRYKPHFLKHVLPLARILWIVMLAIPLATFVMHVQLPSFTTAEISFDFFGFVVMEISFISIIIALVFRWSYSLLFMLAATFSILVIDQLLGGPMTVTGYLSYSPLDATRYYGIGNEGASLVFASWIMFSGLILKHLPSSANTLYRRAIFPLGSLFIIMVCAAPWWGSNFGVLVWGIVGMLVAWAMFNRMRVTWKHLLLAMVIAVVVTLCVFVLDTFLNGESHLGISTKALTTDGWKVFATLFINVVRLSWNTITFSPFLSIVFVIIVAFLAFLRWGKPGAYQQFWNENPEFTGAYTALMVTAVLMLIIEDSGILMPALVLLYETAGLIWLLCNKHSWHIRNLIAQSKM